MPSGSRPSFSKLLKKNNFAGCRCITRVSIQVPQDKTKTNRVVLPIINVDI
jgi:hypothetical protein